MIKILIADNQAVVRRGLIQILSEGFPEAILGEASNAQEALQIVRNRIGVYRLLISGYRAEVVSTFCETSEHMIPGCLC